MSVDRDAVAAAIVEVASRVILPRFGRLERSEIRQKDGPDDLVTDVDVAAEAALEEALLGRLPGARFLGEEGAARNPTLIETLSEPGAVWVVDPLDGTRNFIRGRPEFGTIVALVVDGETRGAWIFAASEGVCLAALKGDGDVVGAGAPRPAGARPRALRSLGWLATDEADGLRSRLKASYDLAPETCSAYAYLRLVRGEVDVKVSSRIHPWDHLAGSLMLAERGGRVAFLDGTPYGPGPSVDRALLATAPGRDWREAAQRLRG